MKKNILYLTDNCLYLKNYKHQDIIKVKLAKGIMDNGKIASINKFITKYESLSDKYNLNKGLIGEKILIVVHDKYTAADISLLKNIFEKLNYRQTQVEKESKYLKLNQKDAYVIIWDNYINLYYIDEFNKYQSYLIESNFFNTEKELFNFLKSKIKKRNIYLLGNGKIITEMYQNFENKYHNKTYMFTNSEYYLLENIKAL